MKKNKLKIEKFRIAKLNNYSKINGGNGVFDGDNGPTGTGDNELKERCLAKSLIRIKG